MTDPAPAPRPPSPAATILLVRDRPAFQVLMVKRHHQIDFASGALVFPGGKAEAGDADPLWEARAFGWAETAPSERALKIAAIREAFEESGVLLARSEDRAPCAPVPESLQAREAVSRGERTFLDLVSALKLRLDLSALSLYARWITPPVTPKRFDTWFFIALAPRDQLAVCDGSETVDAEWISPNGALRLAAAGERKVIFPTRMNLQLLAESAAGEDAIAAARRRPGIVVEPRLEDRDGVRVLTLAPEAGYGPVAVPLSEAM
jgi:8-oxo-dGTP pyrophosphatase MutT (NUDIX family)